MSESDMSENEAGYDAAETQPDRMVVTTNTLSLYA